MAGKRIRRSKSTEWTLGQPLAFPLKLNRSEFERLAEEAVKEAARGPFKRKRAKRKKK